MATKKPAAKSGTSKSKANASLAAGAAAIKKAEAERKKAEAAQAAANPTPAAGGTAAVLAANANPPPPPPKTPEELLGKAWKPSDRPADEIVGERVQFAQGNVGIIIDPETPVEERIPILEYFARMEGQMGFFIGDVLVDSEDKFGDKWAAALALTGKSLATLRNYATVARAVPIAMRQPLLEFSKHKEVARLTNPQDKEKILAAAAEKVANGATVTTIDIRAEAAKVEPPKAPRGASAKKKGKGKGKGGKGGGNGPPPPHTFTEDEQAIYDDVLAKATELDKVLTSKQGALWWDALKKTKNTLKKKLGAHLASIKKLADFVEKYTGYGE